MALIQEVNPDVSIWKQNPALGLIKEFKELKLKEGDERSSNIIKAIFYIWDTKSKLRDSGLSEQQLIEDINTSVIGDPDFNWHEYWDFKEFFIAKNVSKLESMLIGYENDIRDLEQMLADWKWGKKDLKQKAEARKQLKILVEEYADLKRKALAEADENVVLEGGYTKSLVEGLGSE